MVHSLFFYKNPKTIDNSHTTFEIDPERPFIYLLAFIYSVTALSTTKRSSLLATSQAV